MFFKAELVLHFLILTFVCNIKGIEYNLFGYPGLGYLIEVNIGHPPQKLNVLVDTGSSTLAVAAVPSSDISQYFHAANSTTLINTGKEVHAEYIVGDYHGILASDFIRFPSLGTKIPEVVSQFVLITDSSDFFVNGSGWQGILGLAYPVLAESTSTLGNSWLETLEKIQGHQAAFSLTLCGVHSVVNVTHYGKFSFLDDGEVKSDDSFCTPILRELWYEIGVLGVRVLKDHKIPRVLPDNTTVFPNMTEIMMSNMSTVDFDAVPILNENMCRLLNVEKSIVDSGTTNIRLPDAIFRQVVDELRLAARAADVLILDEFWYQGEVACWPEPRTWRLPRLALDLLSVGSDNKYFTIELPSENYMRLVLGHTESNSTDEDEGALAEYCYKLGLEAGADTVLGVAAMEGMQVIFNKSSSSICWRQADCGASPLITGYYKFSKSIREQCELIKHEEKQTAGSVKTAQWAAFAVLNVAISLLLYLAAPFMKNWCLRRYRVARARFTTSLSRTSLVEAES